MNAKVKRYGKAVIEGIKTGISVTVGIVVAEQMWQSNPFELNELGNTCVSATAGAGACKATNDVLDSAEKVSIKGARKIKELINSKKEKEEAPVED